ncbi:YdiY family protein [Colwelliaceae bacterium MEBiC 14330]
MNKFITSALTKSLIASAFIMASTYTAANQEPEQWQKPTPVFKQDFDWVKLTSDEWLKGDIVSMYDETLEFDSDELDLQTIDWEDVAELRSKELQSIRMFDGTIAEGYIVIKDGQLTLVKDGVATPYELSNLLSIASSAQNERDLWDGYVNIGVNLRDGNTVQVDYTLAAGVQRRSASSRFKADFTTDYSRYEDQDTGETKVTADSQRLTSSYDWFFSPKIYLRAADFEYIADEFLNLDYRVRYDIAAGYHIIDNSRTTWDVNAGPSYQKSKFIDVQEGESDSEDSMGLTLGTDFTYEITSDIDFDASYSVQMVDEASGKNIHHLETGLEIDLANDFDLDLTFYADRTDKPKADSDNNIPEKNDFRLVIGLGYDF